MEGKRAEGVGKGRQAVNSTSEESQTNCLHSVSNRPAVKSLAGGSRTSRAYPRFGASLLFYFVL